MATAVRTEKKKSAAAEAKKANFGKVVQVIGPVLDVEFESEHLPELYNALRIREKTDAGTDIDVVVEVQQHIGRNQVRAVAMSSARRASAISAILAGQWLPAGPTSLDNQPSRTPPSWSMA